jgi:hypothetical protein
MKQLIEAPAGLRRAGVLFAELNVPSPTLPIKGEYLCFLLAPLLKPSDTRSRKAGAKRPGKDPGVRRRHKEVPSENPLRQARREGTPQRCSLRGVESGGAFLCVLSCRDKKGRRPPGRDPAHITSPQATQ